MTMTVLRHAYIICGLLSMSSGIEAQTDSLPPRRYGAEVTVSPGSAIAADYYEKKWLKGKSAMALQASLRHATLPQDSDAYARDFGYPVLSATIKYNWNHGVTMHREAAPAWGLLQPVDYVSHMGNIVSAYGTFERPFFRTPRWQADYSLSFGVGYSHSKYNTHNAIDNELIGSRWLIYFGTGLHATWHISPRWGLRAGIDFYHHSNGAMNRPNKGANIVAPSVGLVYEPYYTALTSGARHTAHQPFRPFTFIELSMSMGLKTLHEDWQQTQFRTPPGEPHYRTSHFRHYTTRSLHAAVLRRYARRWASGVGIDLFHVSYADRVAEIDRQNGVDLKHSPWSYGISARHQVYYHNLSLRLSLGYYLYREMGENAKQIETPYYEHIGLHYAIPALNHLSVGINVKAHKTKADYTEFSLSYPITL